MGDLIPYSGGTDRTRFERLLAQRFPAIAAEIDESERGLLHMEMAAFARGTCAAIDRGDSEEVEAHLGFIDELFCNALPDLENAIYVSYLENVFLRSQDERYLSARRMLSDRLRAALADLEDHWKKIADWVDNRESR